MRENILYVWLVWKHGCSRWTSDETCKSRPSESVSPRRDETGSSPKAPARKVAQATCSTFWASEHLAQARGVSPKRDPALLPASPFEPSPRRTGGSPERARLAWARTLSLSEGLGEAVRCLGVRLFLDDWYWFRCELYDEKHLYNGVLCMLGMNHELCMTGLVWKLACEMNERCGTKGTWY